MKSKLLFLLLLLGSSYITAQTVIENPLSKHVRKYTHHLENRTLANRNPTDDTDCVPPAMVDQSGQPDLHLRSRKQKATVSPAHRRT